jgi:diguanylate cyclase (GGDEF)-like protein
MPNVPERRQQKHQTSIYADVIVELTQMTFRGLLPTVLLTGAGLVGTITLLAWHYQDRWLYATAALLFFFASLRAAFVATFNLQAKKPLTLRAAYRWQTIYATVTLGYCFAMALSTLYNFHFHDSTAWTLCTIGTFMICAGLSARTGLHPRILQVSGLILLLALAIAVILSRDPLARVGLILIGLFGLSYYQAVQTKFDIIVEQMRSRRTLSLLSDHDPLTGLSNRRHFEASLATLLLAEASFAILFISLEHFKEVNDTYGPTVGDVVLQRVGVRLKASVRRGDLVARLDGDEFAILQMAEASRQAAESLARRINRAIETTFEVEGNHIQISTHIGIRLSTPEDRGGLSLPSNADIDAYRTQAVGGGSFDPSPNRSPAA